MSNYLAKNPILIFGFLVFLAIIYAYLSGILQTSFILFSVMSVVIIAAFVFANKKATKVYQMDEIKQKANAELLKMGLATESGAKFKGIYRLDDDMTASPNGGIWLTKTEGDSDDVLLFDAKSGEPFVAEFDVEGFKSPLDRPKEKTTEYVPLKYKREIKEEAKPS